MLVVRRFHSLSYACLKNNWHANSITHRCLLVSTEKRFINTNAESEPETLTSGRTLGITPKQQRNLLKQKPEKNSSDTEVLKVAVIGSPNAGKSTLTNQLIGWKIAPVSNKVHTTRQKTLGTLTEENKQVIFLDTPGLIVPGKIKKHNLERSLLTDPHSAILEADLIAVVVDVSQLWNRSKLDVEILKVLHVHLDKKSILILNKVDLIREKHELLGVVRKLTDGVVDGVKDWSTKREKKKKVNLRLLFDKTKSATGVLDEGDTTGLHSKHATDSFKNLSSEKHTDSCDLDKNSTNHSTDISVQGLKYSVNHDLMLENRENIVNSFKTEDSNLSIDICESVLSLDEQETGEENENKNLDIKQNYITEKNENKNLNSKQNTAEGDDFTDIKVWKEYQKRLRAAEVNVRESCGWPHFSRVFMISALSGDGVREIKEYMLNSTHKAEWVYHPSLVTDQNPIRLARLCVWERLLEHLPDKIPYQISVRLFCWETEDDGMWRAGFDIICPEKRHLRHVLGPDGKTIRLIAREAKQQLMNAFRTDLSLRLVVKGSRLGIVAENKEGYH